ncbi:hypothetical protein [Bilophila wadsworthia]|uniref:hypothetical protein n=1 Tax=Bilophila wadsworthia TaxID=35833 RepID=UPI003521AF1E
MESQNIMELEALMPVEMDAGLVFSGVSTGNKIWGYQNPCLYTPAVDPNYCFHESAWDATVWFMNKLDPLYRYDPTPFKAFEILLSSLLLLSPAFLPSVDVALMPSCISLKSQA